MKRSWNTLSQLSNGVYAVQDFERAAYRLVVEQVLYASDRGTRLAYHLVEDHFDDFIAALAPLGIRLERNAHYRYVVALPAHAEGVPVTLAETLLLLVLRQRYDEAMRQGMVEDEGVVTVELPELQEAYQALADAGWMSLPFSEAEGGSGGSLTTLYMSASVVPAKGARPVIAGRPLECAGLASLKWEPRAWSSSAWVMTPVSTSSVAAAIT